MELNDLKMLAAASLLGGSVRTGYESASSGNTLVKSPSLAEITEAVKTAQRIWLETIKQDRE